MGANRALQSNFDITKSIVSVLKAITEPVGGNNKPVHHANKISFYGKHPFHFLVWRLSYFKNSQHYYMQLHEERFLNYNHVVNS